MDYSQFTTVIFDSDGVLVDSEVLHIAAELEMLARLGLTYDRETYLSRFVGLSNKDFHAALRSDCNALGANFPSDFGEQLEALIWPRVERDLRALPGIKGLVRVLRRPRAVASSAPRAKLLRKLEITGLLPLFAPHIYSAEEVAYGKPAPDLFLYSASRLSVSPAKCLVIEDSIHGVVAARAAGMTPIGFIGGSHADDGLAQRLLEAGATNVVAGHNELANLLES